MDVAYRKCSRHRILIVTSLAGVCLCLVLINSLDRWAAQNSIVKLPKQVNDPSLDRNTQVPDDMERRWEAEYESRIQRVRDVCDKDEIVAMRRIWRVATNRRFGKETFCKTKLCPVIVDEQKVLFFCFIPKVASTSIKKFFLNISDIPINETLNSNVTALHLAANDALRRISPMYYPTTTVNRFFKIMFVRHPFDRLVSAFRDKAESPREEVTYFYDKYWDPVMKKVRPKGSPLDKITFPEFVWYLTHTLERDYDEHWASFWSRCDPCLVDYNFIGKLETAKHDFPYAFRKVGIESPFNWWSDAHSTLHSLTLKYFASVPEEEIRKLYSIYKLDFELFGYSIREFLPSGNVTMN
ncbi:unnamed protein product [Larinioides sclopetarius]|uniref:Carbohydrate sulfotransferase n=1 Tax=Larinioides sclopetarius TaxID=280406 RepID=A0AAV1ZLL4_9ARAC